jgi:glycosyltransferase involved in cell wall biosynthesis
MRALIFGSQSVVLCRRRRGGFPIKLLNYMEAQKPIIAFENIAPGFEHMTNAWLLDENADAGGLAAALRTLAHEPALRQTLGAGARELLETDHGWKQIAQRTCALAENVMSRHSDQ